MTLQDRAKLAVAARQLQLATETVQSVLRSSESELQLLAPASKCEGVATKLKPFHRLGRAPGPGRLYQRSWGSRPLWVFEYSDEHGKRHRKSLCADRELAEAKSREIICLRDMRMLGLDDTSGADLTLAEISDHYLRDLATRAVPDHIRNVTSRLGYILAALPAKRVGELRAFDLMQYRSKRRAEGASARTANLDTDAMRAMLRWAKRAGLISSSPIEQLPRLKETEATKRCRRRALTEAEIERLLQAAAEDDRKHLERVSRFRPGSGGTRWSLRGRGLRVPQLSLWRCLLECGTRYGETIMARWADVDLDQGVLYLRAEHTKAGSAREIPLLDRLVADLRAAREMHALVLGRPVRPDDRLFLTPEGKAWPKSSRNIARIYTRLLRAAGIDRVDAQGRKVDIHALRHSAATRFGRAGMPMAHMQYVLGHRDPRLTTRTYGHLDAEDVRASIARIAGGPKKNTTETGAA